MAAEIGLVILVLAALAAAAGDVLGKEWQSFCINTSLGLLGVGYTVEGVTLFAGVVALSYPQPELKARQAGPLVAAILTSLAILVISLGLPLARNLL